MEPKHIEKPFYTSKKFLSLVLVGIVLIVCSILKVDPQVTASLARAFEYSLPIYIGGQAYIDAKVRERIVANVGSPPVAELPQSQS